MLKIMAVTFRTDSLFCIPNWDLNITGHGTKFRVIKTTELIDQVNYKQRAYTALHMLDTDGSIARKTAERNSDYSVLCYEEFSSLHTKRRLLYLKTQFVPRSKHFSSWL